MQELQQIQPKTEEPNPIMISDQKEKVYDKIDTSQFLSDLFKPRSDEEVIQSYDDSLKIL